MSNAAKETVNRNAARHMPAGVRVPTAGPASSRAEGRFIDRAYTNAAGTRRYKLYVPGGYTGQPVPLIVMLHGCTQAAGDLAVGSRMNELAEAHTFLVAYPQQAGQANRMTCWNWWRAEDQQRGTGEPSLIAGITQEVLAAYRVDARRVYVAGISAGGALAAIMGATYPDLYAAVSVHSGVAYGAAHNPMSAMVAMRWSSPGRPLPAAHPGREPNLPTRFVPVIVFQGDQDRVVNKHNADRVIHQWVAAYKALTGGQSMGVSERQGQVPGGRAYKQALYVDSNHRTLIEQWTVHGADHAWAGGSEHGSWTDPAGPNASAEMVRFFLAHPR